MPRIPRNLIKEHNRCYHIISRTTGQEFALGETEKEYLMQWIKKLSSVYFVKVFGFCILSNHFHLLIQMEDGEEHSDEEIEERFRIYYGKKRPFSRHTIPFYRRKWSDLSEFARDVKQRFSLWYNRRHERSGYFWSERFKSVVVEDGAALLACMAYIDLNPVRAGLVDRPENYRFSSLGYHMQSGNRGSFLHMGPGTTGPSPQSWLHSYRRYVYEVGGLERADGKRPIPEEIMRQEISRDYRVPAASVFRSRSRYFTDSVVLGSKIFVRQVYGNLSLPLNLPPDREPVKLRGVHGIYSLRRLRRT